MKGATIPLFSRRCSGECPPELFVALAEKAGKPSVCLPRLGNGGGRMLAILGGFAQSPSQRDFAPLPLSLSRRGLAEPLHLLLDLLRHRSPPFVCPLSPRSLNSSFSSYLAAFAAPRGNRTARASHILDVSVRRRGAVTLLSSDMNVFSLSEP